MTKVNGLINYIYIYIKISPNFHSKIMYSMKCLIYRRISPNIIFMVMKGLCIWFIRSILQAYSDTTKYGCVSNLMVYQTLIDALWKCNRINEALKLLEEMTFLMECTPTSRLSMILYRSTIVLQGLTGPGSSKTDWLYASSCF